MKKINLLKSVILFTFMAFTFENYSAVIYVNHAATGTNNGISWANAYTNLQDAITNATSGDEIWIAKGTYYTTSGTDRNIKFRITKQISIYGHFDGNESAINDRDLSDVLNINSSRTILSGNIGDPALQTDNSHILIDIYKVNGSIEINGITIQDGYTNSPFSLWTHAINRFQGNSPLTLRHLLIYNNFSTKRGSGVHVVGGGSVLIENCRFKDNVADHGSAYFHFSDNSIVRNSDFINNTATNGSGIIYNHTASMTIENCSFTLNKKNSTNPSKVSCIDTYQAVSPVDISNSVFWNNGDGTYDDIRAKSTTSVSYSIVKGGYAGTNQTNVINQDPLWVGDDLYLSKGSPAIDAGNNSLYTSTSTTDIDGDDRFINTTIDMGSQEYNLDPNAFVITVQTTNPNESITIPTRNGLTYDYDIDWGDGTNSPNQTADASHSYSTAGEYQIQITNTFPSIDYNKQISTDRQKVISIDQWGTIQWENFYYAFSGCSAMEYKATDAPDLSNVTSLIGMFQNCSMLNGDLNNWNTSTITDMRNLFKNATIFNGNLSGWDVSQVTNMGAMFQSAISFNQDLKDWQVGNVTNIGYMFYNAQSFDSDLSNWDVRKVKSMAYTFGQAFAFKNGNNSYNGKTMNSWEVDEVENMIGAFQACSLFNADISSWNTHKVTNMSNMFKNATLFNSNISTWNVGMVTNMGAMFQSAIAFNQDLKGWDVKNVTNMGYMFYNAQSFDSDLSNWDVSKVKSLAYTFGQAFAFKNGNNSYNGKTMNDWKVDEVENMIGTFQACSLFNADISNWNTHKVTNMGNMFRNASNFNSDISGWDVNLVSNMASMFENATAFNQSLESWDITQVTNMVYMLYYAGLDECNYDRTLRGWNNQSTTSHPSLTLYAHDINFGTNTFKDDLTLNKGWTIIDAGQGSTCPNLRKKRNIQPNETIEEIYEEEFRIYPNPTSNNFNIAGLNGSADVRVYNSIGELVIQQTIIEQAKFDISHLPNGTYVINIWQEAKAPLIQKIIKQ